MLKRAHLPALILVAMLPLTTACSGDDGASPAPVSDASDAGTTDSGADTTAKDTVADVGTTVDTAQPGVDTATAKDTAVGTKDTGSTSVPNTSFATAEDLELAKEIGKELKPTGAIHYYKFSGVKGQVLIFNLQTQQTEFKNEYIDTVLTIFDADKKKFAENDDPLPRVTNDSSIFTVLPSTGVYYVTVQECWTWVELNAPGASCAQPKDKVETAYTLDVRELDPTLSALVPDDEKGNGIDSANAITYTKVASGAYGLSLIYGNFSDAADVDVFSFTPPSDTPIGESRGVAYFDFYPAGPDGNGSTTTPGAAWLASAVTPTKAIAKVDLTKGGALAPPLKLGEKYFLYLPHAGGAAGDNDFYFANHRSSGGNPIEADDSGNNTYEGAEVLTAADLTSGGSGFFIEGNLTDAKTDKDHYLVAIPNGADQLSVACSAQRSGSGLRDLTVTVLNADGSSTTGLALETAKDAASIQNMAVPAGTKSQIIQLKAGSQAADVSGDYYRCGVYVTAKQ